MSAPTLDRPGPQRPARAGAQRPGSDFTALTQRVRDAGLMRRRYGYYWTKLVGAVLLTAGWVVAFVLIGESWWQLVSAAVFAVLMTQIAFLGHDAAHRQIFRSGRWNDWASLVLANLLVGLSYGWWQSKHTRHHSGPNKVGTDPDIELPVLAFTPGQAERRRHPVWRWLTARQGWYFFPLLLLEGVSLHWDGLRRVVGRGRLPRRWWELSFLVVRLGGLVTLVLLVLPPGMAAAFLGVQLAVFGIYMGSAFAPNHIGMPLVAPGLRLDFMRKQVLMSRNVSGGWWMSVLMGGLNHQIEHHLFPSMARPNLRRVRTMVLEHCAEVGVPYTEMSLPRAYRHVIGYLNTVGLKGRDPFLCPLVAVRRTPSLAEGQPAFAALRG